MVGFGLMDNTILIHAGDQIEKQFGEAADLTGLQAAAFGQVLSDFSGVIFGGFISGVCIRWLSPASLTDAQQKLRSTQLIGTAGGAIGVVIGCLLGMLNLMFMDLHEVERRKAAKELDTIFEMVMASAKECMLCPRGTLFIVDQEKRKLWSKAQAGYRIGIERDLDDKSSIAAWVAIHKTEQHVLDVQRDPRFCSDIDKASGLQTKEMLCYPVFSQHSPDKVLAVVQFVNKPGGFLEEDKRVMRMLCQHCSIFMAKME